MTGILGHRVRERREAAGLSLRELSAASSLCRSAIHDIEHGRTKAPKTISLECLAIVLECSTDYLLGRWDLGYEVAYQQRLRQHSDDERAANLAKVLSFRRDA